MPPIAAVRVQGMLEEVTLLQDITEACRSGVRAFVEERTDESDQVRPAGACQACCTC